MTVSRAAPLYDMRLPDVGGGGSDAGADNSGGVPLGEGGGGSSGSGVFLAGGGVGLRRGVAVGVAVGSVSSSSSGVLLLPALSGVGVVSGVDWGVGFGFAVVVPWLPVDVCPDEPAGVGVPATGVMLFSPAPVGDAPGCTGNAFGSAVSG